MEAVLVWWMLLWACAGSDGTTDSEPGTDTEDTEDTEPTDQTAASDTEDSDTETSDSDTDPSSSDTDAPSDTEDPDADDCTRAGFADYLELTDADELREALHDATDGLEKCDYGDARDLMFLELDNVDGFVSCVYTDEQVAVSDERPDGDIMNTEHTWPQSLGAGDVPAKCDLHHLFPTMNEANQLRASHPFGEVATVTETMALSTLGYTDDGTLVFEPPDDHKGNVGRALLYFSVRYELELDAGQLAIAQAWHTLDPPDEAEIARSFAIADAQGHANPFVVCPELALVVDGTP